MNIVLKTSAALSVLCLTGCVATENADRQIEALSSTSEELASKTPPHGQSLPVIEVSKEMYFGGEAFRKRRGAELPASADRVLLRSFGDVDVTAFASLVTKATGIPVALNVKSQQATGNAASLKQTMSVLWDGPLAGVLDQAAAKFGIDWEYQDGVIVLSDERTETFVLHALPTTAALDAGLKTGEQSGSGGSSGGSSGQSGASGEGQLDVGQTVAIDVWKDVQSAVGVIVGERGRFALTPSNGTLTVTSSPAVLAQVARFVRTQNDILTRQVFIRMKIYSVEAGEGDDAGFKITSIFQNAAQTAGVNWTSPGSSLSPAAGSLNVNIMGSSSRWNGSTVVAQALSTSAKSTLLNELTLTALNNRPVVRQEVRTQSYIERTSVTEQERSTTTEITPAKLSTGFTASVLPRIISENRILLQYAINLSTLIRFDRGESGTSSVQLPTFDASSGWQETSLRSGEVLVLLGFLSNKASDRREGTGHPDNFLFGGTRAASTQVRRVVITLEPVIVSGGD